MVITVTYHKATDDCGPALAAHIEGEPFGAVGINFPMDGYLTDHVLELAKAFVLKHGLRFQPERVFAYDSTRWIVVPR